MERNVIPCQKCGRQAAVRHETVIYTRRTGLDGQPVDAPEKLARVIECTNCGIYTHVHEGSDCSASLGRGTGTSCSEDCAK
jgi:hypothetical protein